MKASKRTVMKRKAAEAGLTIPQYKRLLKKLAKAKKKEEATVNIEM